MQEKIILLLSIVTATHVTVAHLLISGALEMEKLKENNAELSHFGEEQIRVLIHF